MLHVAHADRALRQIAVDNGGVQHQVDAGLGRAPGENALELPQVRGVLLRLSVGDELVHDLIGEQQCRRLVEKQPLTLVGVGVQLYVGAAQLLWPGRCQQALQPGQAPSLHTCELDHHLPVAGKDGGRLAAGVPQDLHAEHIADGQDLRHAGISRQNGHFNVVQSADDIQQTAGVEPLIAVQRLRREDGGQPYPLCAGALQGLDEYGDILPVQAEEVKGRGDDNVPSIGMGHLEQRVVQQLNDLLPPPEERGLMVVVGLEGDVAAVPVVGGLEGMAHLL